jgi:SAM-dependent methyltransferase
VVSIFRYSEISESNSRVLNPLSESKLDELGRICRLGSGQRHLDLACGKGEMLCRFALHHGVTGVGVDIYPPFVVAARARAADLGVEAAVTFREGDASELGDIGEAFDVVSCIGATWIGGGLPGTLRLMRGAASADAWFLVGEVFWAEDPPPAVRATQEATQTFADLAGTLDRIEVAGLELVEMVLASADDWDRYQASQWLAASDWLAAHPDDPEASDVRRMTDEWRRWYLADLRRCMGWGVFVLRDRS